MTQELVPPHLGLDVGLVAFYLGMDSGLAPLCSGHVDLDLGLTWGLFIFM